MWWFIGIVMFLLFSKLDHILKLLKNKDPSVEKEKIEKNKLEMDERYELIANLKDNIGNICKIKSTDLYYVNMTHELTARILDIDEDWIKLEYIEGNIEKYFRKKTVNQLVFKISSIQSISVLVEN